MILKIPYGSSYLSVEIDDARRLNLLEPRTPENRSVQDQVANALENPIGSVGLSELARSKKRVVIVSPDHTRPMPSCATVPALLTEIRKGNPSAEITLLVATGLHRKPTPAELEQRYGQDILGSVRVVCHDPDAAQEQEYLGTLPSGAPLYLNRAVLDADLLIAEGLIEPHFFAGYSGGRKLILPGIAGRASVYHNHSAQMIGHHLTQAGQLSGNPVAADMDEAARRSGLAFVLSVCVDIHKNISAAFAGDPFRSHDAGCRYLQGLCEVTAPEADLTIAGNGGYPLDQNLYQAVKGMYTASRVTKQDGIIVMCAECIDGVGGEGFRTMVSSAADAEDLLRRIEGTPPSQTAMDQWEAQVLGSVLRKCRVILVSDHIPEELARALHLLSAPSLDDALEMALSMVGSISLVNAIPDGVAVVAKSED